MGACEDLHVEDFQDLVGLSDISRGSTSAERQLMSEERIAAAPPLDSRAPPLHAAVAQAGMPAMAQQGGSGSGGGGMGACGDLQVEDFEDLVELSDISGGSTSERQLMSEERIAAGQHRHCTVEHHHCKLR